MIRWLFCFADLLINRLQSRNHGLTLAYDWLTCWFANLPLDGPRPSHQTINNFETWLMDNHADLFFGEVVRQVVVAFAEDDWIRLGIPVPHFQKSSSS